MKLLDYWNKNNFSVFNSEEYSTLELMDKLEKGVQEVVKVVDNKTDNNGNHMGAWQGIEKPTQCYEGIGGIVEEINKQTLDKTMSIQTIRDKTNRTTYYITTIPYNPSNPIKKSFALDYANTSTNGNSEGEYPRIHAQRKVASFAINGSAWYSSNKLMGVQIKDGKAYGTPTQNKWYTLGVKSDGTLKSYDGNATNETLLNDGVINSFCFTIPLIEGGVKVADSILDLTDQRTLRMNRQIIGQKSNKDYVFLTTEGRLPNNLGLTLDECIDILLNEGCIFAYNLDGGGSAQTIVNGALINVPVDSSHGVEERKTGDILYFSNTENINGKVNDIFALANSITIQRLSEGLNEQYKGDFNNVVTLNGSYPTVILNDDGTGNGGVAYSENGKNKIKINLRKDGVSFYDYNKGKNIFAVGTDGNVSTALGTLGNYMTSINAYSGDINNLNVNGIYFVNPSTSNLRDASTGALIHVQLGSSNTNCVQLNIPMNGSIKKRTCSSGTWGSWE